MSKLSKDFYLQDDVVALAKSLAGKLLVTKVGGKITSGIITETEAYNGVVDKASHAFNGRRTARNEHMYNEGGTAYVYICYGIHTLFNVVTNQKNIPHAILIRAIKPVDGINVMLKRRNKLQVDKTLSGGPGTTSQALGIHITDSGLNLRGNKIWIEDAGIVYDKSQLKITPRIGVESAGEAAKLPYRFLLKL